MPWHGIDVWLAFCTMVLLPGVVLFVLKQVGLFSAVYGRDLSNTARGSLWGLTLALPCQVLVIVGWLYLVRGARPYQLGLMASRLPQNVVAGYLAWQVLTPLALCFFALLTQWQPAQEHT